MPRLETVREQRKVKKRTFPRHTRICPKCRTEFETQSTKTIVRCISCANEIQRAQVRASHKRTRDNNPLVPYEKEYIGVWEVIDDPDKQYGLFSGLRLSTIEVDLMKKAGSFTFGTILARRQEQWRVIATPEGNKYIQQLEPI